MLARMIQASNAPENDMQADEGRERNGGAAGEPSGNGVGRTRKARHPVKDVLRRSFPPRVRPKEFPEPLAHGHPASAPKHGANIRQSAARGSYS